MNDLPRPPTLAAGSPGQKFASSKKQLAETGSKDDKADWRAVYDELTGAMGVLNSSIDRRIAANDNDFMEAYRVSYKLFLYFELMRI